MKEAMFYRKIENNKVRCLLCWRRCVVENGKTGFCRVRKNFDGKLYSLIYGKIISAALDPIEKKPFYHFFPGSKSFSIAFAGCTLACRFCCNYEISQEWESYGIEKTAKEIVSTAENLARGISFTYTEPTLGAEFLIEIAELAEKRGLYTNIVTNGYTTCEAAKEIAKHIDAAVIDFKNSGNAELYSKLSLAEHAEKIFDTVLEYKRNKVWIEITNLIVTKYGENEKDVRKFCRWVCENLGELTPVHFLRYFPSYKLSLPPTPLKFLEKCYEIAKEEGLKYVYLGNVPGKYENTYCHECGELLIRREGFFSVENFMKNSCCPKCGAKIPIIYKPEK